ncbi:MAG: GNAT family N-acetyltransferase [Armatimonadota bacterium]
MVIELEPEAFSSVAPLFDAPYLEFVISALVAGNCHGRIWVDDLSSPSSAFIWNKGPQYYFAGREENQQFNDAVKQIIAEQIAPAPDSYMIIYYSPDSWTEYLPGIFPSRTLQKAPRCLYKLKTLKIPNWRASLHQDFSIIPIDRQLLTKKHLSNLDQIIDEIQFMWPSIDLFLERSFGFCALHGDNEIACWCTGEYRSGNHIGIGIETIESYQRKGLATLTASAFAEHCIMNGIEAHWDCWSRNVPSVLTAEKVGFLKTIDYDVFWGNRE